MDFGLTDDQREIQRTARELLSERARPERVREHAEAGTHGPGAVERAVRARLARYRGSPRSTAARVWVVSSCRSLRGARASLAPVPFLASVLAATLIEHAGSPESSASAGCRELASGRITGAVGVAVDGAAELVDRGGARPQVIVLVEDDGTGCVLTPLSRPMSIPWHRST